MPLTSIIIPVLSLVTVFLFSIQKFSNHIHRLADDKFKKVLHDMTSTPLRGVFAGTLFTSLIQSSTATTVILVGLANAGLLSFRNTLGVIFGANIGTTVTTQLVAFKLTSVAPYIILFGFLVSYFGRKYKRWGKPIFYFGMTFFSLSLIALYIEPVKSSPEIVGLFSHVSNIYAAILLGMVFTIIVQASGVTSGLAVIFAGAGLLDFDQAIGIILGANLGTTATALVASIHMNMSAKKVAIAHFLFNFLGILIFLPFAGGFSSFIQNLGLGSAQEAAMAHLVFNMTLAIFFLVLINPFERIVDRSIRLLGVTK